MPCEDLDTSWPTFDYSNQDFTADPKSSPPDHVGLPLLLESEVVSLSIVEASGLPTMEEDILSASEQQTGSRPRHKLASRSMAQSSPLHVG